MEQGADAAVKHPAMDNDIFRRCALDKHIVVVTFSDEKRTMLKRRDIARANRSQAKRGGRAIAGSDVYTRYSDQLSGGSSGG
jgi:hypothetical protein